MRRLLRWLAVRLPYLKDHMEYTRFLESRLTERNERVDELESSIAERDERVSELVRGVEERDKRVSELMRGVVERDERVSELLRGVAEHKKLVGELERGVIERDNEYSALKHEYDERWNYILQLENEKKELLLKTINIGSFASGEFWENIYAGGGNSGTGSYSRLAEFKAETVNGLIKEFGIRTLIDFGCGDGNQLAMMDVELYVGVDVSESLIARHRDNFANDISKSFFHVSQRELYVNTKYDASLSQEVIFHLLENEVFEKYMDDLFCTSSRIVIIYSSNHESYTPWPEYRHRNFSHFVTKVHPEFELIRFIPNKYPYVIGHEEETSASDYYVFMRSTE